jgi:hypothetical protein
VNHSERARLKALVNEAQRRRRSFDHQRYRGEHEPEEAERIVAEHVPYVRAHKTGRWEIR